MKIYIRVCLSVVPFVLFTAKVDALSLEEIEAKQLTTVQYPVKVTGTVSCSKGNQLNYQLRKVAGILEIYPYQFPTPTGPYSNERDTVVYGVTLTFDGFKGSFAPQELYTDLRVKPLTFNKTTVEEFGFGDTGTVVTSFQVKFTGAEWLLTRVKGTLILHDTEKQCFVSGKFTGNQKTPIDY
jgi:hypothetical protein